MLQTQQLLKTLKKQLRANGITYADIAIALNLSEASIKRLFAEGSFSLSRFEQVCELAGLGFSDLVEISQKDRRQLEQLSLEQEKEIAEDLLLLLIAVSAMNGMSFDNLIAHYNINELECLQKFAKLDKLKFLELLPGNRIRLLISANFRWQRNGPIQSFFQEKVVTEFLNSKFQKRAEKLLVLNGLCSQTTNKLLQEKMEKFALEFADLMKQDAALPIAEKKGNTLVFALREWQFGLFSKLLRN